MTTTTDIENLTTRAHEVKVVLRRMIATIEDAEIEAAEVTWHEEKEKALSDALSTVQWRCAKLAYDMRYSSDDTVLRLTERQG